jgi:hypothetical protein
MESLYNINRCEDIAKELNISITDAKAAEPDVLAAMMATKYAVWLLYAIEASGFKDFKSVFETAKKFGFINKDWIPCTWDYTDGKFVGLTFETLESCFCGSSTLTAAEYFARSNVYKMIKSAFAAAYNITIDDIGNYLLAQGCVNDSAAMTDVVLGWLINTAGTLKESVKIKDAEINTLKNQIQQNNTPAGTSFSDPATLMAALEQEKQILEARLKKANKALSDAGLEEV